MKSREARRVTAELGLEIHKAFIRQRAELRALHRREHVLLERADRRSKASVRTDAARLLFLQQLGRVLGVFVPAGIGIREGYQTQWQLECIEAQILSAVEDLKRKEQPK